MPSIPDELSGIVERMMAKEPAARFATPAEVAAALAPFTAHGDLAGLLAASVLPHPAPADAAPVRLPVASSPPWWRRRSTLIAAAAIPASLLLGVVIYIEIKATFGYTPGSKSTSREERVASAGAKKLPEGTAEHPESGPPPVRPFLSQAETIGPPLNFARPQVASVAYGQFALEPPGWRLVAYKGNIYFAPWDDGTANPSKILRYNPADGLRNGVNHTKLAETTGRFTTMKEMGGSLYYAASTGFVRKFDGTTISPITESPFNATDYVTAMAEFNGKQYFGTVSGSIYEYDRSAWRKVYENPWSGPVSDLCAWKGSLFAGLYGDVRKNNGSTVKSNADVLAPTLVANSHFWRLWRQWSVSCDAQLPIRDSH